ncbi:hypothetical protein AVEN_148238-1 [Araneus ventricosus]|uniref:Uncharacterized protein n=1 Tax=Araneus ventricosus TaxID=182803 RepID=A0A4Y2IEG8_ARAVE|nr:hypothetical protein AVEN_148238-1 [Araneus ventricosus]
MKVISKKYSFNTSNRSRKSTILFDNRIKSILFCVDVVKCILNGGCCDSVMPDNVDFQRCKKVPFDIYCSFGVHGRPNYIVYLKTTFWWDEVCRHYGNSNNQAGLVVLASSFFNIGIMAGDFDC